MITRVHLHAYRRPVCKACPIVNAPDAVVRLCHQIEIATVIFSFEMHAQEGSEKVLVDVVQAWSPPGWLRVALVLGPARLGFWWRWIRSYIVQSILIDQHVAIGIDRA